MSLHIPNLYKLCTVNELYSPETYCNVNLIIRARNCLTSFLWLKKTGFAIELSLNAKTLWCTSIPTGECSLGGLSPFKIECWAEVLVGKNSYKSLLCRREWPAAPSWYCTVNRTTLWCQCWRQAHFAHGNGVEHFDIPILWKDNRYLELQQIDEVLQLFWNVLQSSFTRQSNLFLVQVLTMIIYKRPTPAVAYLASLYAVEHTLDFITRPNVLEEVFDKRIIFVVIEAISEAEWLISAPYEGRCQQRDRQHWLHVVARPNTYIEKIVLT